MARDVVTVTLLKKYRGLNPGENGGFSTKEAQILLKDGTAQAPNAPYPPGQGEFPKPPPQPGDELPDDDAIPSPPQAQTHDDEPSTEAGSSRRGPGRRASKQIDE